MDQMSVCQVDDPQKAESGFAYLSVSRYFNKYDLGEL